MLRKFIAMGLAMWITDSTEAQDSSRSESLKITGSADVYYKYEFSKQKFNNLTSFTTSHNSFEPGMASLKLEYQSGKAGMVADLGFGKRAQEFSYQDESILQAVKQLYVSYQAKDWLKLTAGSWATHVGYELVDAYANRNYSMSYLFTNGPFFHTGVKAEATLKSSGFMIGIANPTDFKYVPDGYINKKFLLAQYSYAPGDHFKLYVNYVGGEGIDTSKSRQFDLVLTSRLSPLFSLAYNGTINRTHRYLGNKNYEDYKSWWGSAVYLNFDPSESFGLTLREEYFSDENGLKVYAGRNRGGSIVATTLSANLKTAHFLLIPELRVDRASEAIFLNYKNQPSKQTASFLVAAIYSF